MVKLYPRFVTLMGGIGLGLALTYFVGVGLVFVPTMEAWSEFFGVWAIPMLVPPYLLLVVHLVLRNHVGRFLLTRGAMQEAVEYSSRRVTPSLMRGKRESANQRVVWGRALIGQGRYEEAKDVLASRIRVMPARYEVEARRWLVEVALREDDRLTANELLAGAKTQKKGGAEVAALKAAEAELAIREEDIERVREAMMGALWSAPASVRVGLTRVLAALYAEDGSEMAAAENGEGDALRTLAMVEHRIAREIPARGSELKALRGWVLMQRGEWEEARACLEAAKAGAQDRWSEIVVERVSARLESEGE